nr:glycosyltransferase [Pseudoclavibacter chungangensis]
MRSRVRIVQPIRSGDPSLAATLATSVRLAADAHHEIVLEWLVDDDDRVAEETCTRIRADAPADVTVRVVTCPPAPADVNPKTWKLARATDQGAAPHPDENGSDVLVVLDDDTELTVDGLDALVAGLAGGAAIATGLPAYRRAGTPWSRLTADWVNTSAVPTYLGMPGAPLSVNGMCYAVRPAELRARGGFDAIAAELTDDFAIARLVGRDGTAIVQTSRPQWISTHVPDLGAYLRLMHRWMTFALVLLRRIDAPSRRRVVTQLGLPPVLLAVTLACAAQAAPVGALVAIGVLAGRAVVLREGRRLVGGRARTADVEAFAGGFVTELAQPLHALHAALDPVVTWRGHRFGVARDGTFQDVGRTGGRGA